MTDAPYTVVVGSSADALAGTVAAALRGRGIDVLRADPFDLADLRVSLSEETFTVEGRAAGALVFRAPPDTSFSRGFRAEDRSFCDTETRALWLAASHLASVLAVNRYGAGAWFGGGGWVRWRPLPSETCPTRSAPTWSAATGIHMRAGSRTPCRAAARAGRSAHR